MQCRCQIPLVVLDHEQCKMSLTQDQDDVRESLLATELKLQKCMLKPDLNCAPECNANLFR